MRSSLTNEIMKRSNCNRMHIHSEALKVTLYSFCRRQFHILFAVHSSTLAIHDGKRPHKMFPKQIKFNLPVLCHFIYLFCMHAESAKRRFQCYFCRFMTIRNGMRNATECTAKCINNATMLSNRGIQSIAKRIKILFYPL